MALAPDIPGELAALMGAGPAQGPSQGPVGRDENLENLRAAIQAVQVYQQGEPDEEDTAVAAQCIAALQKLMAKNQQEQDKAMGVTPQMRLMRRQGASGGGAY